MKRILTVFVFLALTLSTALAANEKLTERLDMSKVAFKELMAVLQEHGVERIDVANKPFNPHEMECIEVVPGEDNIVIEEILPGYRMKGKILRIAQVKVGKQNAK